jgi:hypothetical protein
MLLISIAAAKQKTEFTDANEDRHMTSPVCFNHESNVAEM